MADKQVYTVQHTAIGAGADGAPAFQQGDDFVDDGRYDVKRLLDIGAIAPKTTEVAVYMPAESIITTTGTAEEALAVRDRGVTRPLGDKSPSKSDLTDTDAKAKADADAKAKADADAKAKADADAKG